MPSEIRDRAARASRGFTLIEAMAAMAVLMIGATGMVALNNMGNRINADARRMTRATAIALDLVNQIALWQYADPRLANTKAANDDAIGDPGFDLERTADPTPIVDHAEADLGAGWQGIPTAQLATNGFERYWNVSFNDPGNPGTLLDANGNATADGMRIAVIVRWPYGAGWRRIVFLTSKVNPADE